MIVSDHFVYIHTSRTGGTFLNKLILENVPGARMIQYHGHLKDLPTEYSHLPVIGFVRNPWDWYVSMYYDYRRKQQYVYDIVSNRGELDFEQTVTRFLTLGDDSDVSRQCLERLVEVAPSVIDDRTPPRRANPGLRSEHFANYPENFGYYSWLFQLMYESRTEQRIHIGRFEDLRNETLRLFELTGTPVDERISTYLEAARPLNASRRPRYYGRTFSPELERLVGSKDQYFLERFGYAFSDGDQFPKTDFFKMLGSADIDALLQRVREIPNALWQAEDDGKPNKYKNLNNASHIIFRFVEPNKSVYDSCDYPLWNEWKNLLLPIMEQAAQGLGYEDYRFPRVMLARLPARGTISPHTDGMASHYIHKIHVPLVTNPKTIFHIGRKSQHLRPGEIVEVNNKRSHAVKNAGDEDRIHLVFECYNMDDYGK